MTVKEELITLLGEDNLKEKIEEKKNEFYNLINEELALKLISREEGTDSKTILVLDLISMKQGKEYDCIDEKGYFTLITLDQKEKLDSGRTYALGAFKQEENSVRRTYSTKIFPRKINTREINLGGNKILIGIPDEVRIKEYKKCYKCMEKNCLHEKQNKKMAIININKTRVIAFDFQGQTINQETCFIGTEKTNQLTKEKEVIAKRII